jgi:hypothetical protein
MSARLPRCHGALALDQHEGGRPGMDLKWAETWVDANLPHHDLASMSHWLDGNPLHRELLPGKCIVNRPVTHGNSLTPSRGWGL